MAATHPPLWSLRSHRFRVALTLMFAMFLMISNSSNLGMAIICMVNSTTTATMSDGLLLNATSSSSQQKCSFPVEDNEGGPAYQGTLEWEKTKQSYLFSANYYGSLLTVFFSGTMADRFGPKRLLLCTFTISTLLVFAAPLLANFDYWAFFTSRFIIGMGDGFLVPCINSLGGWWFPDTEKSSMAALYTSGVQVAAGSSSLIGSRLCEVEFAGGWPLIFYLYGTFGVIFLVCFYFAITDHPSDNKWLKREELKFLESSHQDTERKKKLSSVPWISILTSPAIWTCVFCNLTFSLNASMNINFLPSFFKEELALPLSANGLYTMMPFVSQLVFKNISAYAADRLKLSGRLTPTQTAKIFQAFSSFVSASAYIALAFLPTCERTWIALVLGFIFGISYSCAICGYFTCMLTIAPAYSGTITSIMMIFGQLGNALAPNTVSFVTHMEWPHKWQIILLFAASLQILSGIVFMIFGSGDQAPWARSKASLAMEKQSEVEMVALRQEA